MEHVNKDIMEVAVGAKKCLTMTADEIIAAMNERGLTRWGVDLHDDRVEVEVFNKVAVTITLNDKDFTISGDNTPSKALLVLDETVTLGEPEYVSSKIALALYPLVIDSPWFK